MMSLEMWGPAADAALPLRDVHLSAAPAWWPLAPGWWFVLVAVSLLLGLGVWRWRHWRRRQTLLRAFDNALQQAASAPEQVAVMSEWLRRAARYIDPEADRLVGEAWLQFLDRDLKPPVFTGESGRLLLEGAFRPQLEQQAVNTLRGHVRRRFRQWVDSV